MTFLEFFWTYGVGLSVPVFCFGLVLAVLCGRTLLRVQALPRLACLPVAERQKVTFDKRGRILLRMEGVDSFDARLLRLSFHLVAEDGSFVPSRRLVSTTVYITAVGLPQVFDVPRAGSYTFMIRGLEPISPIPGNPRIVFEYPTMHWTFLCTLGFVAAAVMSLGSLTVFAMKLFGGG